MSMLAEPRRKQKISIDPQNKSWKNDEDKFGKKLMEKMGWKDGQGLGADNQGMRETIKLKQNFNAKGLGSEHNHDDTWLAHQDDFSAILASLNKKFPTATSSNSATPAEAPNSGDEKSAQEAPKKKTLADMSSSSRARINYHKFTKGKDLKSQSADDVATVLGIKRRKSAQNLESLGGAVKFGEIAETAEIAEKPAESNPEDLEEEKQKKKKKKKDKKRKREKEEEDEDSGSSEDKKKKKKKEQEQGEEEEEQQDKGIVLMHTTSELSVHDYFQAKMKEKMAKLGKSVL